MSENQEREKRILSTASELFIYYGYDKTTVSDIADQAGVSKGAIYLHFSSKEDLLEALIIRETQSYAESWLAAIEADPAGGTIGGMYKNILSALKSSPFMAAMFSQDGRILGNYLRKPDNFFRQEQFQGTRHQFLQAMQQAGVIRDDIDPKVLAHIINMIAYGLLGVEEVLHKDEIPPLEDVIDTIALIMDRALSPENGADNAQGKAILRQFAEQQRQTVI